MNSLRIETLSSITTSNICIPHNYMWYPITHLSYFRTHSHFLKRHEEGGLHYLLPNQNQWVHPEIRFSTSSQGARPWAQWPVRCGSHEPPRVGHLRDHNDVMATAKRCEHVLTPLFVIHEWIPSKTQNVCIQNPCEHNVCSIQMYSITPVTLWLKWAQHTNQSSPLCFGFSDFWLYLSANLFPSTLT